MSRKFGFVSSFAIGALALALTAPVSLAAQSDVRSSSVPRYHLVQLSVDADVMETGEFKAKTAEIRSCSDAGNLARAIDADFKRNRYVRASEMPVALQTELAELPVGKATQVFGADGSMMRVLVICARS